MSWCWMVRVILRSIIILVGGRLFFRLTDSTLREDGCIYLFCMNIAKEANILCLKGLETAGLERVSMLRNGWLLGPQVILKSTTEKDFKN